MLTEFGRCLRKLRIDRGELLRDMAQKLNVSSAYLSAVETGKRSVPASWTKQIATQYSLTQDEIRNLMDAAELSAQEVRISFAQATDNQKQAALSFAKALDGLSDDDLKKIMEVVHGKKR